MMRTGTLQTYGVNDLAAVTGRGAFGGRAGIAVDQCSQAGVWFMINGDMVDLGSMRLGVNPVFHYLTLSYGAAKIRVAEHLLGCLFGYGVTQCCIYIEHDRLPYDGSARSFAETLECAMSPVPCAGCWTVAKTVEIPTQRGFVRFEPAASAVPEFEFDLLADYTGIGQYRLHDRFGNISLREVMEARALCRSRPHRFFAQVCGRLDQYVHLNDDDRAELTQQKLREICHHRLLDLMGALECIRPPGARLVGRVTSRFAGHVADVELVRAIKEVGLMQIG